MEYISVNLLQTTSQDNSKNTGTVRTYVTAPLQISTTRVLTGNNNEDARAAAATLSLAPLPTRISCSCCLLPIAVLFILNSSL